MVDLFCGCGGLSIGFSAAGFRVALGIDIHVPSIRTFQLNHPSASTILGDIRRVPDDLIIRAIGDGQVAVVVAGVPCEGFSLQNRKRHEGDERNFLFWEFIRVIRLLRPSYVLLENVPGLRTSANGAFLRRIAMAIQESGYRVEHRVLNALDYGVPQSRPRVFFLGALPGLPITWPVPTHGPNSPDRRPYRTVGDAISDLPPLGPGEAKAEYAAEPANEYQALMRRLAHRLLNHEAPRHAPSTVDRIARTPPGSPLFSSYPQRIRLSLHDPSPTLVSGGIRPQYFFGHPTQPRGLTTRECCRIQSIPDHYEIVGGLVQERVQVGNAVPPLLAEAIAREIHAGLRGQRTAHRMPAETPAQLGLGI
ncbi:MAG TPA: DNA cytosine methyltransferase [Dehalococcoidia bacterium]|nr:DNA cytosine methyltransferase [Dehalococcoidia bacterium]